MIKLAKDEKVIAIIRKHWFLPLLHTINVVILFFVPIIAVFLLIGVSVPTGAESAFTFSISNPAYLIFGISFWGLILWLSFFTFWTDHQLDGWVITNKRIVDVEQRGFFKRDIASFRLERLQDVNTVVKGIIATFLNFGDIHVQTAGSEREFVLKNAPNPRNVKQIIMTQHDKTMEEIRREADGAGYADGP